MPKRVAPRLLVAKAKNPGFSGGLHSGHPCGFQGQEAVRHRALTPLPPVAGGNAGAVEQLQWWSTATSQSPPPSFVIPMVF